MDYSYAIGGRLHSKDHVMGEKPKGASFASDTRPPSLQVEEIQFVCGNERLEAGVSDAHCSRRGSNVDELIRIFNANAVRYLVIGGQAVRLEGMPRFSMDWDLFIPPKDLANLEKINRLISEELDMPLLPIGEMGENFIQTYQTRWGIVQFHLAGPGLPAFEEAEKRSVLHNTENGTEVRCLSGNDLLTSKRMANRPQDQLDIAFLEKKKEVGLL